MWEKTATSSIFTRFAHKFTHKTRSRLLFLTYIGGCLATDEVCRSAKKRTTCATLYYQTIRPERKSGVPRPAHCSQWPDHPEQCSRARRGAAPPTPPGAPNPCELLLLRRQLANNSRQLHDTCIMRTHFAPTRIEKPKQSTDTITQNSKPKQ